jgi:hypothetical protein
MGAASLSRDISLESERQYVYYNERPVQNNYLNRHDVLDLNFVASYLTRFISRPFVHQSNGVRDHVHDGRHLDVTFRKKLTHYRNAGPEILPVIVQPLPRL